MTATQFGASVTAIIDAATGGTFEFPDDFESVCARLMAAQMSAEEAAAEIMSPPSYVADIHTPQYGERHRSVFPLRGTLDWDAALMLANNGDTPAIETAMMQSEARRIISAIRRGDSIKTKTAIIYPG